MVSSTAAIPNELVEAESARISKFFGGGVDTPRGVYIVR